MTVKELIALLQNMPQDLTVVIDGYEGGVGSIKEGAVRQTKIWENVHAFPYKFIGDEQINSIYYHGDRAKLPKIDVVLISRQGVEDQPDKEVFECSDYFGIHEEVR
jgi:hypothetical protein